MSEFERVLQECLRDLEQCTAGVEECLRRHPRYAAQLRPVLLASSYVEQARAVPVSDASKARVRARVMQEVRAHPRKPAAPTGFNSVQFSTDPLGTDLKIAARQADELVAVSKDPVRYPQALKTYLETADRLKSEVNADNEARILPLLESQTEKLSQSGVFLTLPEENEAPASLPTAVAPASVLPVLQTPAPEATGLPIPPTNEDLRDLLPTVEQRPKSVTTVEAPPPVR